jgi:hypothetical protein
MKALARSLTTAVVVFGLTAAPARAQDRLRISLAAWPTQLNGSQEVDGDSNPGSTADFGSVLGLGSEALPELHMDFKMLGPFHMVGSYFSSSFKGEETLSQPVTFDDVVYAASEQVKSTVDLDVGKVLASFTVLNFDRIGLGLMVGANLMQMKSQLESAASGQAQKDITAPLPVIGVNLRLQPLKKLAIYTEVSGLTYNSGGIDATSIDGVVRFEYFFVPWVGMTGGFRILDLDVHDDDFGAIDLKQDGGQFGLVFRL